MSFVVDVLQEGHGLLSRNGLQSETPKFFSKRWKIRANRGKNYEGDFFDGVVEQQLQFGDSRELSR